MPIEEKHQLIDDEAVFKYISIHLESNNYKGLTRKIFKRLKSLITLCPSLDHRVQESPHFLTQYLEHLLNS